MRDAVARLGVPYPVAVDTEYDVWELYGNLGWPARYLFDQRGMLLHYHYGEGGYDETELAIQELLGSTSRCSPRSGPRRRPTRCSSRRPTTSRARTRARTRPAACGRCSTGAERSRSTARTIAVDHPGAYELIAHDAEHDGASSRSRSATA